MNTDFSPALHAGTPDIRVLDARGLTVRELAWHRSETGGLTDTRISRHQHDARGFLTQSADPRLHEAGQANFTWLADLAGQRLRTKSCDAGITVALNDTAGRPFMTVSNIGTGENGQDDRSQAMTHSFQYEGATLPGRPLSVTEQTPDGISRITQRFLYASNSAAEKNLNLAGQCVSHYDTAGLMQTGSIALTGVPVFVTRRLLKEADNPETVADWQGADSSAWNDRLAAESYITLSTADATGTVLTSTDATGNLQRMAYDAAGQLSGSWLTLKDGTEQVIVTSLTYSAAGQKLIEEHGNGVVTTYTREPQTQRLMGIKTERPPGHAAGAKLLQSLCYQYDPVGNVVKVASDSEATGFWRNQKVLPESTYGYDSLYQLVSASGREMANAGQQGSRLPSVIIPLPADSSVYTNYSRAYTYDSSGNLTQIRHSAPATNNSYTTRITVSDRSNRAVLNTLTEDPSQVDTLFTRGGHQRQLQPGQNLIWTPRGELLKVIPVTGDGTAGDGECYRYDSDSQRTLKVSIKKTNNHTQTQRVVYLPGLELRITANGRSVTENLQVITAGEGGRAQVRLLYWKIGQPGGISNGQLRYSYDNLTGSSVLKVDGNGNIISQEEYYPYGGTAILTARSAVEADYKMVRYSGKERDATGLYYYGYRYYQPWTGRWLSADPAGAIDGLNLYRMVKNNPITLLDRQGTWTARPAPGPETWSEKLKGGWNALRNNEATIIRFGETFDTFNNIITGIKVISEVKNTLKEQNWGQRIDSVKEAVARMGVTATLSLGIAVVTLLTVETLVGALTGGIKNPKKSSDNFAAGMCNKVAGKSMEEHTLAAGVTAAWSATLNGATGAGTTIAATTGAATGYAGWYFEDSKTSTERGMAAANAAGAAVGAMDTLTQGEAGNFAQYAAAAGGAIGGWILGTTTGSAEVGIVAGAYAVCGRELGRGLGEMLNATDDDIELIEAAGMITGAVYGGIATAVDLPARIADIETSVQHAQNTVSLSALRRAFSNYFTSQAVA